MKSDIEKQAGEDDYAGDTEQKISTEVQSQRDYSQTKTFFFQIIGPYEHNNHPSSKVNNAINTNQ